MENQEILDKLQETLNMQKYKHNRNTTEQIPEGIYSVKVKNIKVTASKNNNNLLLTLFEITAGKYINKTFNYIRAIPNQNNLNSKKEQYKLQLLQDFLAGLGVTLKTIEKAFNKTILVEITYNNNFTNIKIL